LGKIREGKKGKMKKVLILGAGYTVKPMVDYFLDRCGHEVTLTSIKKQEAEKLINNRPGGKAVCWTLEQVEVLDQLVKTADIVIAMVPRFCHAIALELCLKYNKTMLTADFMHSEISTFDEQAKKQGVLILTELGEDPGLDNMGARQMIDEAKAQKGKILSLTSYGAGLPSFEHNRNPFGYKFSWDPKGLMRSAVTPAAYIVKGKKVDVPAKFEHTRIIDVHGIGTFEVYANTDCARYISVFGLDKDVTIFKGLLRFPGWCSTITAFLKLKLIENNIEEDFKNTTYAQFMARLVDVETSENIKTDTIKTDVAKFLGISVQDDIIKRMNWLGIFDSVQIPLKKGNNSAVLVDLMLKKMSYGPAEKDMIIVHNEIVVEFPDRKEKRIASMLVQGTPGGYSAMAGAVSLPVAIAARIILEGKVKRTGVCMPTTPDLYQPILKEMSTLGFSFKRDTIIL
jgi:saccharopine dehydrogenase (NADP+, L-glutamate forming)